MIHHDWGVLLPGQTAVRVPVSHLTAAQFKSLQPQVMINGPATNEYALARAADAAAMRRLVVETHQAYHIKGHPKSGGGAGADAHAVTTTARAQSPLSGVPGTGGDSSSPTGTGGGEASASASGAAAPRSLRSPLLPPGTSRTTADVSSPASGVASSSSTTQTNAGTSTAGGRPPTQKPLQQQAAQRVISGHRSRSMDGGMRSLDTSAVTIASSGASPLPSPSGTGTSSALAFYYGLQDTFTTLAELLARVPPQTGFNIEMKYPTAQEAGMFGLRPWERNAFVDRVLDVVHADVAAGRSRSIMFSSFDPDVCLLLARKQALYPVFLLSEGGTADPPYFDYRWNSLAGAVAFARAAGLFGVVTDVTPLLVAPQLIRVVQEEAGLVLCSYGRRNNDAEAVTLQQRWGIGAVISDHVAHVARTLRATAASAASTAAAGGAA